MCQNELVGLQYSKVKDSKNFIFSGYKTATMDVQ